MVTLLSQKMYLELPNEKETQKLLGLLELELSYYSKSFDNLNFVKLP